MRNMNKTILVSVIILIAAGSAVFYWHMNYYQRRIEVLNTIIERLSAESRIAQVMVTESGKDKNTGEILTTIKFLEYDAGQKPLKPKYFTFSGNIIQFQSLVIRFKDIHIKNAGRLKNKSAYIFWKVFSLRGDETEEYVINPISQIPTGYKIKGMESEFEKKLWEKFWNYALNNTESDKVGVKNAQIEAPGTKFVPGTLYIIKIEHDGGMRIDTEPVPEIFKGEFIPA